MNETKTLHTPGPWHMADFPYHIFGPDGTLVCEVAYDQQGLGRGREKSDANAHLIAAAPDLLEACERALNAMVAVYDQTDVGHVVMDEIEAARAAIAKAKGETV